MKYVLWFLALILVLAVVVAAARFLFVKKTSEEARELLADSQVQKSEVVTREDLKGLPAPVQKWLENSGVIGHEKIRTVRLKQRGMMRTTPQGSWMPFEAEQYFDVKKPGFVWLAQVKAAPLVHLAGRDKYYQGRGHMLIKALSLIKVVDSAGKEVDQGAMLRYLAEMQWFPTAALNDYIRWEPIDDRSAKATMTWGEITASGVFSFDQQGNLVSFFTERYREQDGVYTLTGWGGRARGFKEFGGIRIPNEGDVIWKLPEGDFNWFKYEIAEIEYNRPEVY